MEGSPAAGAGVFTGLTDAQVALVLAVGNDPLKLCAAAQGLLRLPGDAFGAELSDQHLAERNTRPASGLLQRALEFDGSPLDVARPAEHRVVGTCRHYAVLATAFLRAVRIPARARCGFASYFVPGKHVDHWITEHWSEGDRRWLRTDPEVLGTDTVDRPDDLRPAD
ncbi:MAG TPA: transglutaminase-like domain-containing protein, partial [Aquihabitans sp.]|nr:transglutaminase-like domain-containing protein [Aquihabitans sp.]